MTEARLWTLPNLITLSGIAAILFYTYGVLLMAYVWLIYPLIFYVWLTDALDGFLARRLNQKTKIGALLDSIRDYLLLVVSLISFGLIKLSIPSMLFLISSVATTIVKELITLIRKSQGRHSPKP